MSVPAKDSLMPRWLIPGLLFVAIVGGLAWFTQQLPNWRARRGTTTPPPDAKKAPTLVCRFFYNQPVWDKEVPAYILEYERGEKGHCDFAFENPADLAGEMGLLRSSCDCSSILVAFPPTEAWEKHVAALRADMALMQPLEDWPWTTLKEDAHEGVPLPPKAKGILRVTWKGRKAPGERLNLMPSVWHQPKGDMKQRQITDLLVPIVMTHPVVVHPPKVDLGVLGIGETRQGKFLAWSPTRTDLELAFAADPEGLVEVTTRPLTAAEREEFRKDLYTKGEKLTRLRSAVEVNVTVHEQRQVGKRLYQLDLGPFARPLNLLVDGFQVEGLPSPYVVGTVRGEVEVGSGTDQGKVNLRTFASKNGVRETVVLWTDPKVKLQMVSHHPETVDVKLEPRPTESTARKAKWIMEVRVPPNVQFGPFAEDAGVLLRLQGPQPRQIRIPIIGTAIQ